MDTAAAEAVIRGFLREISKNLSRASSIAAAAEVCAEGGNVASAVKMIMDIEDPTFTTDRMMKAILLIRGELQGELLD